MSRLSQAVGEALGAGAPLAERIPGFVARPAQQRLAMAVADAFEQRGVLLAEAGTGTGKTFAYLVPALLSGMKTIISTGTRALQDQLYHARPAARARCAGHRPARPRCSRGAPTTCAGTGWSRPRASRSCSRAVRVARAASQFQRVVAWSGRTRMGDLAELDALPEDSPLLPQVTSTADNCLGSECPFWSECFVVQARQRAQTADLVVVNHHLLLADLALKQEGFGEILPGAQAFVVDEAHQLPELAAQFFGEGLGARPLVELARDALGECKEVAGVAGRAAGAGARTRSTRRARCARRWNRCRSRHRAGARWTTVDVEPRCQALADALDDAGPRAGAAARGRARVSMPATCAPRDQLRPPAPLAGRRRRSRTSDARCRRRCEAAHDDGFSSVHWYELTPRGFRLQRTPLDVSGPLRAHRERIACGLGVHLGHAGGGGQLRAHRAASGHRRRRPSCCEPSPFDWDRQALCYLPPRPARADLARLRQRADRRAACRCCEASGGRAFLLFTSHRALREAAELLRDAPWPLFVQGSEPRHVLLQRFRESGNGVLLGTASFREGVDVAGDALSVVVIDKLPFAAPDDPVFEARLDAIRRAGGNPFRDEQLPQAVIALKQGVGRLIRSRDRSRRAGAVRPAPARQEPTAGCSWTRCRRCRAPATSATCRPSSRARPARVRRGHDG